MSETTRHLKPTKHRQLSSEVKIDHIKQHQLMPLHTVTTLHHDNSQSPKPRMGWKNSSNFFSTHFRDCRHRTLAEKNGKSYGPYLDSLIRSDDLFGGKNAS